MNRRDFHRALLGTLGAALLPADARALRPLADPRTVDGERLLGQLRALSRIGATPEGLAGRDGGPAESVRTAPAPAR